MSLQVWLPLNGDLHNQGLSNVIATNNGATIDNNGKIGKCYNFNGSSNYLKLDPIFSNGNQILSFSCWIKISALPSSYYCLLSCRTSTNNTGINIYLKSDKTFYVDIGSRWITSVQNIEINKWYHIAAISSNEGRVLYINGIQKDISTTTHVAPATVNTNSVLIGAQHTSTAGTADGTYFKGYMNDVRIYNHALSAAEVAEIAKGLVLHYKLNNNGYSGNSNLLIGSAYTSTDIANFVSNGSTDWTKFLRYYNGSAALHSFANGVDTIKLNSTSNIGISFVRSATDINLDTSSKYTISCEAQCSSTSKPFCIGLSYYTTSNSWVWRGGSNGKNFTAANTWQKFTLTFTPDANTQYINYCFTAATGGNNILKIRNCKLEKGTEATPWMPAFSEMNIHDCSGYQNNGTVIGELSAAANTPKYETSIQFYGSQLIEANPLPAETSTLSAWVNFNTIPTSNYTIPLHDKVSGLAIGIVSGNRLISYVGSSTGGTGSCVNVSLSTNTWYHIVVIKTGSTTRKVYINGEEITSIANNNWWGGDLNKFNIGGRHISGSYSSYFNGKISDVRAYAMVLSNQQIKELYNTSASIDASGNVYARELKEV